MRATKIALSALAVAFALSGTAYAMDAAKTTTQPAANAAVHKASAPAKHRLFKKSAAKKAPTKAKASATTSTTNSGTH